MRMDARKAAEKQKQEIQLKFESMRKRGKVKKQDLARITFTRNNSLRNQSIAEVPEQELEPVFSIHRRSETAITKTDVKISGKKKKMVKPKLDLSVYLAPFHSNKK